MGTILSMTNMVNIKQYKMQNKRSTYPMETKHTNRDLIQDKISKAHRRAIQVVIKQPMEVPKKLVANELRIILITPKRGHDNLVASALTVVNKTANNIN